ncbi:transposase [Cellulomonas sp. URHB0016]
MEGIVYRYRTGVAWRDLPAGSRSWQTVWKRGKRFSSDGTWDNVLTQLLVQADAAGQIDRAVSIDSTINRTRQHAATLPRTTGGGVESHESGSGAG